MPHASGGPGAVPARGLRSADAPRRRGGRGGTVAMQPGPPRLTASWAAGGCATWAGRRCSPVRCVALRRQRSTAVGRTRTRTRTCPRAGKACRWVGGPGGAPRRYAPETASSDPPSWARRAADPWISVPGLPRRLAGAQHPGRDAGRPRRRLRQDHGEGAGLGGGAPCGSGDVGRFELRARACLAAAEGPVAAPHGVWMRRCPM